MKTHPMNGWPADGSPGEWLGWDADGRLSILRWCSAPGFNDGKGGWIGVRFDPQNLMPGQEPEPDAPAHRKNQWPLAFMRGADTESFVVKHRPAVGARGE